MHDVVPHRAGEILAARPVSASGTAPGRAAAAAVLLALALLTGACRQAPRLNLLLVTFDTTRADRIGCYGNTSIRTPAIDGLAAEGVRFDRAISAVPITTPSHSTIMTGKYPLAHGVRDNGMFVLGDGQTTLAEVLRDGGWATGAGIGAYPLTRKFGLDQGFDFYDDHVTGDFENVLGTQVVAKSRLFFDERRAARVNEAVLPWLTEHAAEPFFLWVHYFDPHQPYEPPRPFDELYATDLYDGEIAYADEALGHLLHRIRELGVYDRTLVVFVADHGEGMGEHRELTHSVQLYDTTQRVPLIMRLPGGRQGGAVDTRVSTADVAPTILELLGRPVPEGVQGRSLAAELRPGADSATAPVPLYAETLSPRLAYNWGELRALYDGDLKYIFGPRPELYDLAADPRELDNLAAEQPETAEAMQRRLARFIEENAASDLAAAVEMDEETRRRLMALGYLHASGGAPETIEEVLRPGGIAPQDRVADVSEFSSAKQLLFQRQPLAARELALGLVAKAPENPIYLELVAGADLQLGHLDRALENLEKIRRLDSGGMAAASLLHRLAALFVQGGEYDRALEAVRQGQALEPDASGRYLEANVLKALGRRDDEVAALEAALELDAGYVPARVDLAVHQARGGEPAAAVENFHRALADEPYYPKAHYNYGTFLVGTEDPEQAVAYFRRAVELEPGYLQAHYALVAVHLGLGRAEEARRFYATLSGLAPGSREAEQARRLLEEAG